jgi:dihydroorotate dehydrogenase electron transfer subunit
LWKVYGAGTELMTKARRGDVFDVLGPLGKGFSFVSTIKNALVIAGGLGIAPMPLLIDSLLERRVHLKVQIGARTDKELWGEELFRSLGAQVDCATDDGSRGHRGFVTALLEEELKKNRDLDVFACGPMPMLAKVSQICLEAHVNGQLSVETVMGCGFGICMGCPMIPAKGVKEYGRYLLTCVDGPVFSADAVQY